ncbi:MAG: AAA family ATPase [Betaproteobacteria bacterium]|nr:MAG: AAA family ATPase [Betaproteobacteria bacterium]
MYHSFFGLSQPPFKITPDTEMFFDGGNRGAILEALIYAISQGEGIVKVTGEVGSGKTMLCRMLQTRLPDNIETIYLANPSVSPDEILHAIAFEMRLPLPNEANRIEAMHRINDYLLERHAEGKDVVLFVEESQSMPLATLEQIRLLSNLETGHHKLLQIVLFGQPELDDSLRLAEIRQLRERITHSFSLLPLTTNDVRRYLSFRLRAAGYRGPELFSRRVSGYINRVSQGLTRRVNIVADKALLAAFADGTHNVSIKHVKAAVQDTEFTASGPKLAISPLGYVAVGLLIGGALGVTALVTLQQVRHDRVDTQNAAKVTIDTTAESGQTRVQDPVETGVVQQGPKVMPSRTIATGPSLEPRSELEPSYSADGAISAPQLPQTRDLLEQRLRATRQWLSETEDSRFTIQLLGSDNAEYLRDDLAAIGDVVELERVFVFRTLANQRPSYTVLLGTYVSRAEAFRQIEALPESIKANGPYFRTIKGIKAEIARNDV